MTIRFKCSECGSVMKITDDLAGTAAHCPKCNAQFSVPEPDPDAPLSSHEIPVVQSDQLGARTNGSQYDVTPLEPESSEVASSETSTVIPLHVDDDEIVSPTVIPAVTSSANEVSAHADSASPNSSGHGSTNDLDCPPKLISSLLREIEVAAPKPETPQKPIPAAWLEPEIPPEPKPKPSRNKTPSWAAEPAAPSKAAMTETADHEPPTRESAVPPLNPVPYAAAPDSDYALDLSGDSGFEIPTAPTPHPMDRRTPVASSAVTNSRHAAEKPDSGSSTKLMKKAIKDSQAQLAARPKEINAKPKVDYLIYIREVGLKGVGILALAVLGPVLLYYVSDYMTSNGLKTPKLGYVTGTVKLDGKPLPNVLVYMAPVEVMALEGGHRERARTSMGATDQSGHFKMMYFQSIEGVAAGKCRAWLSGPGVTPDWMETAMHAYDISVGRQKGPLDINMESRKK